MRVLIAIVLTALADIALAGTRETIVLHYDNEDRPVIVHLPTGYSRSVAWPLVMVFHPSGSNGEAVYREWGVQNVADAKGFVAVFPTGKIEPDGSGRGWTSGAAEVPFIDHLFSIVRGRYAIDVSHVYGVAFSGGSSMVYHLAADPSFSSRMTAYGVVSGDMGHAPTPEGPWTIIDPRVTGGRPMPAMVVHGGQDRKQPINGGYSTIRGDYVISLQQRIDILTDHLGATEMTMTVVAQAPPNTQSTLYTNPSNAGLALLVTVDPMLAHTWPEWDAMAAFWDFFVTKPPLTTAPGRRRSVQR